MSKTCGNCKWSYPAYVPNFVSGWVDPIECGAPQPMAFNVHGELRPRSDGRGVLESTACADRCPLYAVKEVGDDTPSDT